MTEKELREYGEKLAKSLKPGDIIGLIGELGAGKTTLTQAIAAGLGVEENVNSPTFTLINEYYSGRLPLYHFDVYRLDAAVDLEGLGYQEYFYGNGVSIIEWADIIEEYIPVGAMMLRLEFGENENERILIEEKK